MIASVGCGAARDEVRLHLLFVPVFWREDSACEFAPVVSVRFWPEADISTA